MCKVVLKCSEDFEFLILFLKISIVYQAIDLLLSSVDQSSFVATISLIVCV